MSHYVDLNACIFADTLKPINAALAFQIGLNDCARAIWGKFKFAADINDSLIRTKYIKLQTSVTLPQTFQSELYEIRIEKTWEKPHPIWNKGPRASDGVFGLLGNKSYFLPKCYKTSIQKYFSLEGHEGEVFPAWNHAFIQMNFIKVNPWKWLVCLLP